MATKEFKLPDVGEGVAEGELVNWLVAPGDSVSEDQPVAEVETDKALVEVPSPYDGTVKELLAEEGEVVPVGEVIITFTVGDDGDAAGAGEEPAGAEPAAEPESEGESAPEAEPEPEPEAEETAPAETDAPEPTEGRVFAPPSARRLARELGVDVAAVDGSGPGGRVTDADVRAHAESGGSADAGSETESAGPKDVDVGSGEPAATPRDADGAAEGTSAGDGAASATAATAGDVEAAGRERTLAAPATRRAAEEAGVDLDDVPTDETRDGEAFVTAEQVQQYADAVRAATEAEAGAAGAADATAGAGAAAGEGVAAGGDETVPYRGVRRTIGKQMEESKYTAPHVSHHDTAVIGDLVEARAELKERAKERDVKLTYLPFVMKALVAGLKEFPYLNSELREDDEEIVLKKEYNVGIAVATDAGLMVPVVKDVDGKSLLELAEEVTDLANRARERKLSRSEMQGGTFTVTNFGAVGGEYATPIINYPETAIMGLGAIERRPVVEDGEVVAAHTLPLSLSIDHRVIDGAVAARFTNYVMEYLENPQLLLLE